MANRSVYFIRPVGQEGPIKIGSSASPVARLRDYQKCSPVDLEIIGVIRGGFDVEWRIHAELERFHRRSEWFEAAPEVLALVKSALAGALDVDALPPLKRITQQYRTREAA